MSICCAFSFSLILLFGFGFFPWAGVGEACAGVVEYIYIYFILFFFLFGKLFPEQLGFSSSCSSFLSRASPRGVWVCVFVCVCIHCWRRTRPLAAPGALVQDALPFSRFIFGPRSLPAQMQLSVPSRARRTRALIPEEACVCLCVCLEACVGSRGRTRRGVLHHFSKDFRRDFGCGSSLPPPFICQMDPFLLF